MSLASFESRIRKELAARKEQGIFRVLPDEKEHQGFLDFSSNDYFALADKLEIRQTFQNWFADKGMGSKASRLISGNHQEYDLLEKDLAALKKTEYAVIFGSGYLAAIGVITNLVGKGDLVIADKNMHRSSLDAVRLSGAKLLRFTHNDLTDCARLLEKERFKYENCLLLSETLFSMDGDYADVDSLYRLAENYDCLCLVDDAHGLGIFNAYPENFSNRLLILGTLSKALGSYGGYVACSKLMRDYLCNKAASLIYTTALPELVLAYAREALTYLTQENRALLLDKISYFCTAINIKDTASPIIILPSQDIAELEKKKSRLFKHKIKVGAIKPPTAKTPRLRITISLKNSMEDLRKLADFLREEKHS